MQSSRRLYSSLTPEASEEVQPSALGITSYEDEVKSWDPEIPEYYNFARDVIDHWAELSKTDPSRVNKYALWLIDDAGEEVKWTFPQVSEYSKKVANVLQNECGIKRGDVVTTIMSKQPEWWLINLACIRIGAILAPATVLLTAKDMKYRFNACQAKCVIAPDHVAKTVDEVLADTPTVKTKLLVDMDKALQRPGWLHYPSLFDAASNEHECVNTKSTDKLLYFFTSGTTGHPKITVHLQTYVIGHKTTARYWYDLVPQDVMWSIADPGWAKAAWANFYGPWLHGCCVFIQNSAGTFDVKKTLQIFADYPITMFCAPPTVFRLFVHEHLTSSTFKSIRHIASAGEPLNPEVSDHFRETTGLIIREGYGQSETTLLSSSYRFIPNRPASVGKPAPSVDLRIIDGDGKECERHVEGDIAVKVKPKRPVGLFVEYLNEPERTAAAHRGDYYLTGDRGYQDEDDYVYFVSRADDIIISAGYRIGPFEVESALIEHPAVLESAVIGSPDPTRGEVVKAFIVKTEEYADADEAALIKEIQDHTKQTTAPYKYPRKIEFVKELPKTISGKIRRVELRNKEWKKE